MIDLPLIFLGGLLGSSHCLGMCGPFVLAINRPDAPLGRNLVRQLTYTVGRVFTYAAIGAVAGFGGWQLARNLPTTVPVQAVLAIVAGVVLVVQGFASTGLWRRSGLAGRPTACLGSGLLRPFLQGASMLHAFLAGMLTGFMPCGLVYSFLALAGSTGHVVQGALLMAAFGAGTAPALVLLGAGGSLLGSATRGRLVRWAAWCVVLTGAVSVWRGVGYLPSWWAATPPGCPLCQ